MKILLITQYFYPENFKSNDIAFELQKRGHEVTVITGLPNYPEGKIYKDYGFFKNTKQEINGVKIIRSWLFPRGKGGGIRLFINYYSFALFSSFKAFLHSIFNKYDAVIVHEPSPIMQFYPALVVKKMRKTPVFFWVLDLWPETLMYVGGIKNKAILGYFNNMVKKFYRHSRKILISSKGFEKSILEKGDFKDKIVFFPNWAEDSISEGNVNITVPELPQGFKVMFAGNIGECQDMESVMKAANRLKDNENIKFILIGDGRRIPFVHDYIEKNHLHNTVFTLGRFPVETMASFFDKTDMLLVSLRNDDVFNLTVPAKIQAYMSSGKPILGMLNGEGAQTLEESKAGIVVDASDDKSLAEELLIASKLEKDELNIMGKNGRLFFEKNYKMENCISHLEEILIKYS